MASSGAGESSAGSGVLAEGLESHVVGDTEDPRRQPRGEVELRGALPDDHHHVVENLLDDFLPPRSFHR
jgi:hypothetical protein